MSNHFRADKAEDVNTLQRIVEAHTDVTGAELVDVLIDGDRQVLHVNVNGICVLRICRINLIEVAVNDRSQKESYQYTCLKNRGQRECK